MTKISTLKRVFSICILQVANGICLSHSNAMTEMLWELIFSFDLEIEATPVCQSAVKKTKKSTRLVSLATSWMLLVQWHLQNTTGTGMD